MQLTKQFEFIRESGFRYSSRFVEVVAEVGTTEDGEEFTVKVIKLDGVRSLSELTELECEHIDNTFIEAMRAYEAAAPSRCVRNWEQMKALVACEPGRYPATERYIASVKVMRSLPVENDEHLRYTEKEYAEVVRDAEAANDNLEEMRERIRGGLRVLSAEVTRLNGKISELEKLLGDK